MIVGDPSIFAIESEITEAYDSISQVALGYFVIHVLGKRYGVCAPDATLLACSFDEVKQRLERRGEHVAPFSGHPDAGKIADGFRDVIYSLGPLDAFYCDVPQREFTAYFSSQSLVWAPDGDEAFDDGSYILQFDEGARVRLIGFKNTEEGYHHDPATLADLWLDADAYYGLLQEWLWHFEAKWKAAPKHVVDS